jgi:RNA polymerase sigma factor (sigma-70 family)
LEEWRVKLDIDSDTAWELFIGRYRGLILSVVRRTVSDEDDVSDIFAEVCALLSADQLARLRSHTETGKARFSTWLVTVVQRIAIDWIRRRDGRRRVSTPGGLSPIQSEIFDALVRRHCSHVEAYELTRQRLAADLPFGQFMKEVRATYSWLAQNGRTVAHYFPGPPDPIEQGEPLADEAALINDSSVRLTVVLQKLTPDERLAVRLFVIDELSADEVAKIVGWPNAKAVYNRVYRALRSLRGDLSGLGVEP